MMRRPALPLGHPATLLATWFGCGLSPRAPGTVGSLGALPVAALIHATLGPLALALAALLAFAIGLWASARYAAADDDKDPSAVVIDEVAGQWLTLAAVPLAWPWYAAGFVLFRLFDILKPWPVSWADRRLPGAWGIMVDDMLAGLYAGAVLLAAGTLLGGS